MKTVEGGMYTSKENLDNNPLQRRRIIILSYVHILLSC
jgi:hypothetical protein